MQDISGRIDALRRQMELSDAKDAAPIAEIGTGAQRRARALRARRGHALVPKFDERASVEAG